MQVVLGVAMASGFLFYFVVFLMKLLHWLYNKEMAGSSLTPWATVPISQREGKGPPLRCGQVGKHLYCRGIALGKGALGILEARVRCEPSSQPAVGWPGSCFDPDPSQVIPCATPAKDLPLWSPLWSQLVVGPWLSPPEQLPHPLGCSAHLPGPGQATPCRADQD